MSALHSHIDLCCPACRWALVCDREEVGRWLSREGMLRRNPDAPLAEMHELLTSVAARTACPQCGRMGLVTRPSADEAADWGDVARCEACGGPIPAERRDALPGVTRCAACQRNEEEGRPAGGTEYCPRCGTPMVLRTLGSGGITRYRLVCGQWPACRGTG
jgi:hypothetical protein